MTPFYPIYHRKDLVENTRAVYYLLSSNSELEFKVFHIYQTRLIQTYKFFFRSIYYLFFEQPITSKDDKNQTIFFFKNYCFFPKSTKVLSPILKKINLYKKNVSDLTTYRQTVVYHFPCNFIEIVNNDLCSRKVAILHGFDLKLIQTKKNPCYWESFFSTFAAIGFRSFQIQKEFDDLVPYDGKKFMALSGVPNEIILPNRIEKLPRTKKIIFAGRLLKQKNVDQIIRAVSILRENYFIEIKIIGSGPDEKRLRKLVQDLILKEIVHFMGAIHRKKVLEEMRLSDIFIMTSQNETLGLVYLEAMASGCLVIGSEGEGIQGIITNGFNGFLVKPGNDEELIQCLKHIFGLDQDLLNNIRKQMFSTISNLTEEKATQKYIEGITKME